MAPTTGATMYIQMLVYLLPATAEPMLLAGFMEAPEIGLSEKKIKLVNLCFIWEKIVFHKYQSRINTQIQLHSVQWSLQLPIPPIHRSVQSIKRSTFHCTHSNCYLVQVTTANEEENSIDIYRSCISGNRRNHKHQRKCNKNFHEGLNDSAWWENWSNVCDFSKDQTKHNSNTYCSKKLSSYVGCISN